MSESTKAAPDAKPFDPVLQELFANAAASGDRYHCPPLATLIEMASDSRPASQLPAVVRVALAVWAAPSTQQPDPLLVRIADAVLRSFAESLPSRGQEAAHLQEALCQELGKTLDGGNASMRPPIYAFLGSPGAFRLASAESLLRSEAERADRSPDETLNAARSLATYDDALDHARRWVRAGTPLSARAAVGLLGGYAVAAPQQAAVVRELLATLARSPQLPEDAALKLLAHLADMEDRAMLASAEQLQQHANEVVRRRATEVASQLRKSK